MPSSHLAPGGNMTESTVQMKAGQPHQMVVDNRYLDQNARLAVQDIYDALIELITNSDDRYEFLRRNGDIHIEVERRRKGDSVMRVRDFADGMTLSVMEQKLGQLGKRVSGLDKGLSVRGTNSRGAKDVAVLGGATFQSIAGDGKYHKCQITPRLEFIAFSPSMDVTPEIRRELGILNGTGTVVTLVVESSYRVPRHDQLKHYLPNILALRDIFGSGNRRIILRDINQAREDILVPHAVEGNERLKVPLTIPGYPNVQAKLIVKRAKQRFELGPAKFRTGGIIIKARHAIHEATYFAPELENEPHAAWFFGRLTCEYIDDVWNEYDNRREKGLPPTAENPYPILDPLRKNGLRRDHPFTKALFGEALKHFRPLVEEERNRAEKERVHVESAQTRKRLNTLERAATEFMEKHTTEDEVSRDPNSKAPGSSLIQKGYILNPPFAQIVQGHSERFWLNIRQAAFPELSTADSVEIACFTNEINACQHSVPLEPHPSQEGIIRAVWSVTGNRPTKATGIKVRVGSIVAESHIEVLESEKEKFAHVTSLCFHRKHYTVVVGKARAVEILAPYPSVIAEPLPITVTCSVKGFRITGPQVITPQPRLGIAVCKLHIYSDQPDLCGTLSVQAAGQSATAEISSILPHGTPIKIELVDDDYNKQRSKWHAYTLRIATRHPSVRRYLGPPTKFEGQESIHFRVLLAEIVAEAVCQRVLGRMTKENPEDFRDSDWDRYFFEYSKLMTDFLPIAHETQVKDGFAP